MTRLRLLMLWPVCLAASLLGAVAMLFCIVASPARAWVLAVSHDQLANAALGGDPDETVSSRAGRARSRGRWWGCILCSVLDRLDRDHCSRSIGT